MERETRIVAVGDGVEVGFDAVDDAATNLVAVLVKEAVAEDSERRGIGLELLDDEVVVLARLDEGAILTN